MTAFIDGVRAWFQGRIMFRWLYLIGDPKKLKLLFEIGTDSENELLDGRVGKPLRDMRRFTFILEF